MTPADREQREAERQQQRAKRRALLVDAMIHAARRSRTAPYDLDWARQLSSELLHLRQPPLDDAEAARVEAELGRAPQAGLPRKPAKSQPYSVEFTRREPLPDEQPAAPEWRVVSIGYGDPPPKPKRPSDFSRDCPPERGRVPFQPPDTIQEP